MTTDPKQAQVLAELIRGDGNFHLYARLTDTSAKANAQLNLNGRTPYVEDSTLRFFNSRVLATRVECAGLLFGIITASSSLDAGSGFRPAFFDLSGKLIAGPELRDACRTRKAAEKLYMDVLQGLDAVCRTRAMLLFRANRLQIEALALVGIVAGLDAAS